MAALRIWMPLLPLSSHELDVEFEAEVADRELAHQELVFLEAGGFADDFAVFDRPELVVAAPAGEVLAVEEAADVVGVASMGVWPSEPR